MTVRTMIATAATVTTAAVASAGVWYALAPQDGAPAATPSGQSAPAGAAAQGRQSMDVAILCVTPDRVLHEPTTPGSCAPGQRMIILETEQTCALCPPEEPTQSDDPALRDLERRLKALENAPYFEVVNNEDQPVFRVSREGVTVYNKAGEPKAAFRSSPGGGYFTAITSGFGFAEATMSATATAGGLRFVEDGLTRLDLSGNDAGGASLRLPSGNGVIAGFGVSKDGPGTLLIGNLGGRIMTSLSVPGDQGMVQVQGENGAAISLMQQANGGGMLQLDSRAGAIVKMGNVDNRYGIVLAGPRPGPPLVPKSGLPGGFFLGCGGASPPACTPIAP
jgi:hypothetical protein